MLRTIPIRYGLGNSIWLGHHRAGVHNGEDLADRIDDDLLRTGMDILSQRAVCKKNKQKLYS